MADTADEMRKPGRCTARINGTYSRAACVLAAGHYRAGVGSSLVSWHTDCPDVAGKDRPMIDAHEHDHGEDFSCTVWNDTAQGAVPHSAPGSAPPLSPLIPVYTADLVIGDAQVHVKGSAMFVNRVITAAAEAMQEDAER